MPILILKKRIDGKRILLKCYQFKPLKIFEIPVVFLAFFLSSWNGTPYKVHAINILCIKIDTRCYGNKANKSEQLKNWRWFWSAVIHDFRNLSNCFLFECLQKCLNSFYIISQKALLFKTKVLYHCNGHTCGYFLTTWYYIF